MDLSNLNIFSELNSPRGENFSIILTKSVDLRCYFIGLLVGLLVEKIVISVRLCFFFVTLFEL